MKGYRNSRKAQILAMIMATAVVGCGTITGKKKSNKGSNPVAPETSITQVSVQNGIVTATYTSSVAGSKFSCKVDTQAAVGQWTDCPAEGYQFTLRPDEAVTLSVKAIANGAEDATPATRVISDKDAGDNAFAAVITDKAAIGDVYNRDELKVSFGLRAGAAQNVAFECKANAEVQFQACPEGTSYTFLGMQDGQTYSLAVRPVDTVTKQVGQADTLTFKIDFSRADGYSAGGAMVFGGGGALMVGSYDFAVPEGLNVITYATNRTANGADVELFQLDPRSDPLVRAPTCIGNRLEPWKTAKGRAMNYCHSNDANHVQQYVNNLTISPNYIEVGTDARDLNRNNFERISIAFFDSGAEYRSHRSRYRMHCEPAANGVRRDDIMKQGVEVIPVVPSFYKFGTNLRAVQMHWCKRYLSVGTQKIPVFVAGFYNADVIPGTPNANVFEAVYIAAITGDNEYPPKFGEQMQMRIAPYLSKGVNNFSHP